MQAAWSKGPPAGIMGPRDIPKEEPKAGAKDLNAEQAPERASLGAKPHSKKEDAISQSNRGFLVPETGVINVEQDEDMQVVVATVWRFVCNLLIYLSSIP